MRKLLLVLAAIGFSGAALASDIGLVKVAKGDVRIERDGARLPATVGAAVRISEVAIAQGGLTIEIQEQQQVSQPAPFTMNGNATSTVVPKTDVKVDQGPATGAAISHVKQSATLKELVDALNAIGVRPRDLIANFQA